MSIYTPDFVHRQSLEEMDIDDYVWLVPYVENGHGIFLKTAFPSRKHIKEYLKRNYEESNEEK